MAISTRGSRLERRAGWRREPAGEERCRLPVALHQPSFVSLLRLLLCLCLQEPCPTGGCRRLLGSPVAVLQGPPGGLHPKSQVIFLFRFAACRAFRGRFPCPDVRGLPRAPYLKTYVRCLRFVLVFVPSPCFDILPGTRAAFAMGLLATKKDDSELAEALHLEAVLVLDRLPEVRRSWHTSFVFQPDTKATQRENVSCLVVCRSCLCL